MLLAVHISDGYLHPAWIGGGFAAAIALAWLGSLRIPDAEIPRIGLLTAAFFIASAIHVPLGPTSVHLLLNGLVGVVLGARAALAIPIGLFLQALLSGHGGFGALGVNACVMTIPALVCHALFRLFHQVPWARHGWWRSALVGCAGLIWTLSLIFSVALLRSNMDLEAMTLDLKQANAICSSPWTWLAAVASAVVLIVFERRLETAPEFPLGLLLGLVTVLMTLALNFIALRFGGEAYFAIAPELILVAHLPIAVVESLILGTTLGFLAKVKPELLGLPRSM